MNLVYNRALNTTMPETCKFEIASLPSRFLAAGVDYIVCSSIFILLTHLYAHPDLSFLCSLASGLLYFSVVHSQLTKGQSLGKRLFGLRVVRWGDAKNIFLTSSQAAFRYLYAIGILILIAEVPPLFFRAQKIVASPYLLELHMFLAIFYGICSLVLCGFSSAHLALHDRFAQTIVLRGDAPTNINEMNSLKGKVTNAHHLVSFLRQPLSLLPISFVAAVLLWSLGFSSSEELTEIASRRYALEAQYPIRFLSLTRREKNIAMEVLLTSNVEPLETLVSDVVQNLVTSTSLQKFPPAAFELITYADPSKAALSNKSNKRGFLVDLRTLAVSELSDDNRTIAGSKSEDFVRP